MCNGGNAIVMSQIEYPCMFLCALHDRETDTAANIEEDTVRTDANVYTLYIFSGYVLEEYTG